jgi:putative ABC transport system permease protein
LRSRSRSWRSSRASIGIVLGYAIAAALMPGVAGTLRGLYGASVPGTLSFDPLWAVSGLGITLLGAGAASAAAMIRTARMPLLAPAQPRAWAQASDRAMRLQALAALGLFLLGGLVGWLGSGLVAGFAFWPVCCWARRWRCRCC